MNKIAFVFPGQGVQTPGMGKDFYDNDFASKAIFDNASDILDIDLRGLCFTENDKLNITEFTQPALFVTEMAMLQAVLRKVSPDILAGLSLGEYCAVVHSGAFDFEQAVKVVRKRGIFMQEAVPLGGAMSAIVGLDADVVKEICTLVTGCVEIANYNSLDQIVISGEEKAVKVAGEMLKEKGAKLVVPLNVSGPFHSSMLKPAGDRLSEYMKSVNLEDISVPYISNVSAEIITDKNNVCNLLERQVSSAVLWKQSIIKMLEIGIDTFIEIGPGKTLSGFIKKIDKTVNLIRINTYEDVQKLDELDCRR